MLKPQCLQAGSLLRLSPWWPHVGLATVSWRGRLVKRGRAPEVDPEIRGEASGRRSAGLWDVDL